MTYFRKHQVDRREFLALTGGTSLATGFAGTGALILSQPARAASHEWTLDITNPSDGVYHYNGKTTGPVISASAGETIVVNLINSMEATGEDCPEDLNTVHGLNITNLHTHGLDYSPVRNDNGQFDSDNVFLQVVPVGQKTCGHPDDVRVGKNTYHFDLPDDHPPGTHWYHAHKHGSTNAQVAGGLAGPLIIKDPAGHMPDYIADAPERIFLITGKKAIEVEPEGGGQFDHTITLAPGAVERWRIINAEPSANSFVKIGTQSSDIELWQIAFDGLTLNKPVFLEPGDDRDPWESPGSLGPGNRMDVMVRVKPTARPGRLALTAEQAPAQFLHAVEEDDLALAARDVVINIDVAGAADDKPWAPDDPLPGPGLEPIVGPITTEPRNVVFDLAFPRFMINDKQFGEDPDPLFQMKLDSVEEWTLKNVNGGMHPFHIHVNPLSVTHINGQELAEDSPLRRWQDVIAIPGNGSIVFRTRFIDYTGKFVIHCHILGHEDRGMMRVVDRMTRYIAIPKNRPGSAALTETAGGFSASARADRIATFRKFSLEDTSLRPSSQLAAKIEGMAGHRLIATPDRKTPITGVTIFEGGAEVAEDLQNDLPDHEVIEDFTLELVAPTATGGVVAEAEDVDAWHIEAIKLATARTQGFGGTGAGVGVAVLDTGVADVSELDRRITAAFELDNDLNVVEITTHDTDGHGTGVAALVAGKTVGVAPQADILNFITIPHRTGNFSNFLMAAEFIAGQARISVANISAGVPDWDARIKPGIAALLDTYILPVVAVGNEGPNSSRSPGNYSEVISVGACRKDGKVWSGSSSALRTFDGMDYSVPSLVAPGHHITTCDDDGKFLILNGSSLATPIVTGLAALIIEKFNDITLYDLREEIIDACTALQNAEIVRQGVGMAQLPLAFYHQGS